MIFGMLFFQSGPTSSPSTGQLTIGLAGPASISAEMQTATIEALTSRLEALKQAKAISAYVPITFENDVFIIRVQAEEDALELITNTLTVSGFLEFVDVEGQEIPSGEILQTTGRPGSTGKTRADGSPFKTVATGAELESVQAVPGSADSGVFVIDISLNDAGAKTLEAFTSQNIGKPLAIVIDGVVIQAPVIQTSVGKKVQISSNFTQAQAQALALQMGSKPLLVALTVAYLN
jgi:preprotein translocase subunit SecD